ncbi:uncharacterized protein LOC123547069 isoform X2 [Mercenaria mercenaria]|uniref:uncharacterized protein LOC123547069 isoform X2 n=1 Tax=Mercenaria mercenaria TaxID=6596 RepID=UPI00234F9E65|nr:uncharacterized protein LOC123547069 isoform X2 [Mercenaria mercenaria]
MAEEEDIITDHEDDEEDMQRQRMREFNEMVHILFTKPERLILYKILKDYQRRRDVARLVVGLDLILRTYTKLELLKYVRYFVWQRHLDEFDRLTQFQMKFRRRRRQHRKAHLLQIPDHRSIASTSTNASGRGIKDVRVFTVHREKEEPSLGFCVRGGSEHGLGIYVSEIEEDSAAAKSGLETGDKILEVNNISLRGVASSSAIKVLTGSNRLKLVIQRTKKVPEWRLSREKTSWYDIHDKKLISGEFEECGISHSIRGLDVEVPERRINLKFGKANRGLGFNIRGGREYGLGIYVSKVDREGLADKNGVRIGDQIIDVNGIPFENITHAHAVEVLKGKKHLILTLRDVGRFPVYKELYAEYTWSDGHIKPGSSTMSLRDIHVEHHELPKKAESVSDLFSGRRRPSTLHTEIFLPGERQLHPEGTSSANDDIVHNMNTEDDTDSLIDLDQWAQDIQDTGNENRAYVHDEDVKDNSLQNKYVKSHLVKRGTVLTKHDITVKEANIEDIDGDYDSPDMMYAKINKHTERYASTSNLSASIHKEDETKNTESMMPRTLHEDSSSERSFRATENRQTSSNEDLHSLAPSVDGALYSTVRRLSGGSFKNLTGSSLSIFDANQSTKDSEVSKNFDNLEFTVHSEDKLHKKRKSVTLPYAEKQDTDSDDEHGADSYDLINPYSIQTRSFKGPDTSDHIGHTSTRNEDDGLDMGALEDRLQELEERQTNIGLQELNALNGNAQDTTYYDGSVRKKGKWKTLKNKIKGSLRLRSPRHTKKEDVSVIRSTDIPEYSSKITKEWKAEKIDSVSLAMLEDAAQRLLDEDEFKVVKRHIKTYHESHDLERLVDVLLVILDKPEKLTLIKDVRGVIYQHDMVKFDNMVNHFEIEEAYQKLSMKLHLPLNHKPQKRPRRKLITTEIENPSDVPNAEKSLDSGEAEDGHFHIKTMKKKDVVDVMKENVEETKAKVTSPHRQVEFISTKPQGVYRKPREGRIAEEKSALDEFEYLDFEHLEEGSCIAAFSDCGSHGSGEVGKIPGTVIVHLSKTKHSLGIDFVEEMIDGVKEVKIDGIDPNGAANDDSEIQVGMAILAVDRHKVEGLSLEEVCGIIDTSYMDKQHVSMKLVLRKPESTDF